MNANLSEGEKAALAAMEREGGWDGFCDEIYADNGSIKFRFASGYVWSYWWWNICNKNHSEIRRAARRANRYYKKENPADKKKAPVEKVYAAKDAPKPEEPEPAFDYVGSLFLTVAIILMWLSMFSEPL